MVAKRITSIADLGDQKDLFLYGAGAYGTYCYHRISNELPGIIVNGFIDDQKKEIALNIPIFNFTDFKARFGQQPTVVITSSYAPLIAEKLKGYSGEVFIADFLAEERRNKYINKAVNGYKLEFYTPNQFLFEVINNYERIEPETCQWINKIKDGVFYDIGASCGIYAIVAGLNKNAVVAIEPDALNFAVLKRNVFLNRSQIDKRFFPFNLAVGISKEILDFEIGEYIEGFHGRHTSLSVRHGEVQNYVEKVMACDLDSLITEFNLPLPTHLKIDVDGAEFAIVKGMEKTLANPVLEELLIECADAMSDELKADLLPFGFVCKEAHEINEILGYKVIGTRNYLFKR